jgi:23S rRNA (guanosine2251-2'-O)-methyltransferase
MPVIYGINPVIEALRSQRPLDKIFILASKKAALSSRIYPLAKKNRIPVVLTDHQKMATLVKGAKHQGIAALLSPIQYMSLMNLLEKVDGITIPASLTMIDAIQDPHNFGAIIRTAEVLGSQGIIFSSKENVTITDTVVKSSAGAVFHIDICKVVNLSQTTQYLQERGLWIYASSAKSEKALWEIDFQRPHAIIVGSEGKGVRPLLLKRSDDTFCIPQLGKTDSLNVSVATGIILGEILKQRLGKRSG